jgi:uncharacterized protein YdeI (YjbR/CyaY-like superfamily)
MVGQLLQAERAESVPVNQSEHVVEPGGRIGFPTKNGENTLGRAGPGFFRENPEGRGPKPHCGDGLTERGRQIGFGKTEHAQVIAAVAVDQVRRPARHQHQRAWPHHVAAGEVQRRAALVAVSEHGLFVAADVHTLIIPPRAGRGERVFFAIASPGGDVEGPERLRVTDQNEPLLLPDVGAWERWLEEHGAHCSGIWLCLGKKGGQRTTLTYAQALEVALCFGWIDGQVKRVDESVFKQRFTPRRPKSAWSKLNVERVERLVAADRMRPAGVAEVEKAKADGRWEEAYDPPSRMAVPADFQAALEQQPRALEAFNGYSSQNRYAMLYRLLQVKRPETRARRIQEFVDRLLRGEAFH